VRFERRIRIDKTELPSHSKVHHKNNLVLETNEDVLSPAADRFDPHPDDRIDELFGLGVSNDRGERELATRDRPTHQVRTQVRDNRLDLR
jgi:hypothetical protein